MKVAVKRLIRGEKGQAMILAVILLLVGGLTISSLLSYMGTGLFVGQVYEGRVAELYAADAGVEDAVWKIQNQDGYLPCNPSSPPRTYNITVNDKNVAVNITSEFSVSNLTFVYHVVATATGDGSGTQIDAYINGENRYGDYTGILNNVLTSQYDIELSPGVNITPLEGDHSPVENYPGDWPPPEELQEFYWEQVEDVEPYGSGTLDVKDYAATGIGPFYRNGAFDNKGITNTGASDLTLKLNGTVYITGDTEIGTSGGNPFTLDLNGHTIFVASNSSDPQKALWIGGKCNIEGFGIIVAVGDIYFEPNIEAGMTDPVFIMSVLGTTTLNPGGDFYGSIAGSVEVDLQPNSSLNYPEDEGWFGDLNFLIGFQDLLYSIYSWEVSQQ
jgi:hypothetical protein